MAEPNLLEPIVEQGDKVVTSSERALVRRAQEGDRAAFEQLYRVQVGRVYATCLRISGERGLAEELTQDAFVRAWEMLGTYRGESSFSSWLRRLAINVVLLHFRSRRRRTARVVATDDLEQYDTSDRIAAMGTVIDLEAAIASLPPQARTVFVLHDIEGYRHEEIAELMGVAAGTSKAQLHRARKLLKEVLGR